MITPAFKANKSKEFYKRLSYEILPQNDYVNDYIALFRSKLFVNGGSLLLAILVVDEIVFDYIIEGFITKSYHQLYIFHYLLNAHVLSHLYSVYPLSYLYFDEE